MSYEPGEIYFVRELAGTGFGPCVKIGLVAKSDHRSSFERLKEHQTGNPRDLRIEESHIVKTDAVSMVEAQLHKIFAPKRVSGEWFNFPTEHEVSEAISEAKRLSGEVAELVPIFQDVENLGNQVSEPSTIPANDESNFFKRDYCNQEG